MKRMGNSKTLSPTPESAQRMWRTYLIVEGFKFVAGRHFDHQSSVVDGDKPNQAEGAPQRAERGGGCREGQGPTGARRREFPALMPFVRLRISRRLSGETHQVLPADGFVGTTEYSATSVTGSLQCIMMMFAELSTSNATLVESSTSAIW